MILFIIALLVIAIGIIVFWCSKEDSVIHVLGITMLLAGGIALFILLCAWEANYTIDVNSIRYFKEAKVAFEKARGNGEDMAVVARRLNIDVHNIWLQGAQRWNETVFDMFIPDEVMDLEPIK